MLFSFALLLGVVLSPSSSKAWSLSSLFGDKVSASSTENPDSAASNDNSQNMSLLQSNVSSSSIASDKKSDSDPAPDDNTNISSNSALVPSANPVADSSGDSSSDQISVYVVRKGDSISLIAQMFGVSANTILAANDMKRGDVITEGQVLVILPISGIEHTVGKGETLQSIAKLYKVDVTDIASYNGIAVDSPLTLGDQLIIPGGDGMSDEGGSTPSPNLGSALSRDAKYYAAHPYIQGLVDYFINPVPSGHKTQGLHGPGHRGIDIGALRGTPIYAAASGFVSIAHPGWSGGYGNMVIIDHPNGTRTLYAHMSKIRTTTGANVLQGQIIGYVGSTGHSTGPHLHFEVFNAKNPGADWSWK